MAGTSKIYGTVAVGVVGIIGVSLIIKMIRDKKQRESGDRATSDSNVSIAQALNTAMHPGRNFVSNMFLSADTDEIFKLGANIKDFKDISEEYRNLYQATLSLELQNALGDEYPAFINMVQKAESGVSTFSNAQAQVLADSLEKEMIGLNWFGRDITPFNNLIRLSDENFKMVIELYNNKYPESFIITFEGEYAMSVAGSIFLKEDQEWNGIKNKVITRYHLIF